MLGRARSMLSAVLTVALTLGLFPTVGLAEAIEEVNSAGAPNLPSVEQPATDEPAIAEQEGQTQKETLRPTTDGDSSEIEVEDTSAIEPTPDENPAAEVNLTTQGDDEEGTVQGVIGTAPYTWDGSTLVVGAGEFSQVDWVTETEQYKQSATSVTFEEGAKLTDSAYEMFFEWNKLVSVDASNLDTSSVKNMYRMFNSCSSLETIDVSNLSTSQVTTMEGMFALCGRLGSIDLSGWDTSNVTSMRSMFNQCTSLKLLDLSQFVTSNVTTMYHMFYKDANLVTILVGEGWDTTQIGPGTDMFFDCTSLVGGAGTAYDANHVDGTYARVDGGEENPGYLTDASLVESGFIGTAPYTWNGSDLIVYAGKFTQTEWVAVTGQYKQSATSVTFRKGAKLTDTAYEMFRYWEKLERADVKGLDFSSVTSMWSMFAHCTALTSLDLSSLDTSSVVTTRSLFYECTRLAEVDLSGWDTSAINHVEGMHTMFTGCSSLTTLDLSSFKTSSVRSMYQMFKGCSSLAKIVVGEGWDTTNIGPGTEMFSGCTSLVGGAGTAYDADHVDGTYARVDGGEENPGYLTDVSDTKPTFQSAALVLNGTINLRFFMKLSALTDEERQSGYMTFTAGGRERPDATFDPSVRSKDGTGYGFTCSLSSIQMADEVVATYHWGDGLETSKTYSVKDYLQAVLSDGTYDDETVALVRSVADYGHWAQLFLSDSRSWKIGEDYAAIPSAHEMDASAPVIDGQAMAAAASELSAYGTTKHLENSDVEKLTASLSLESQTTINVTATAPSASKVTAKLADGTALGVTKLAGGKWRVALTGIAAHQLGNQWNISIDAGGSDQATVEVSALAYANAAMASDAYKNDEHACGSMTALWHYYQAALAYRAAHPQA